MFAPRARYSSCSAGVSKFRAAVVGEGSVTHWVGWASKVARSMSIERACGKHSRSRFRIANPWVSRSPQ
jgi:hypothetical protein